MSLEQAHEITHITAGAEQTVKTIDTDVTILAFLGANLAAGSANATLLLYDGTVAQNKVICTLSALTAQGQGTLSPSWYVIKNGKINAVLTGTGAVAEVYWNQG